jgi:hypothetical protein
VTEEKWWSHCRKRTNEVWWAKGQRRRILLEFSQEHTNERKPRLFAIACCRSLEQWLTEPTCFLAIDRVERYVEKQASKHELASLRRDFLKPERDRLRRRCVAGALSDWPDLIPNADRPTVCLASWDACRAVLRGSGWDAAYGAAQSAVTAHRYSPQTEYGLIKALFNDVFRNPFCPLTFDPGWRTSDVRGLAQAIYDNKNFESMPILSDALMDAGCDEEEIIGHCRRDGPHVRGCWVVDLVLGKE